MTMNKKPETGNNFLQQLRELWDSIEENENLKLLARVVLIIVLFTLVIWLGSSLGKLEKLAISIIPTSAPAPTSTPGPGLTPTPAPPPPPPPPPPEPFWKKIDWGKFWGRARYSILPIGAFILILLAAGRYVEDIYALKRYQHGLMYVLSSLFGIRKPFLVIDKGKVQIKEGQFNSILAIGGPGAVIVQPGNAVLFRSLRKPSKVGLKQSVALSAFETIGEIINLDDQHNHEEALQAVTLDGIKVKLVDINYRYRIISAQPRTLENPYPFDIEAVNKMAYNRAVSASGLPDWRSAVHTLVRSLLGDYINAHTIDFLTAPREDGQDPRSDMRNFALAKENTAALRNIGADLLWIDVGHIDIEMPDVDQERFNVWAAEWIGNAEVTRAYGEAKRQAYIEIGRAEAQAEMIMSIASSLEDANMGEDTGKNLQYILLARTAQILDSLKEGGNPQDTSRDTGSSPSPEQKI